MELHEVYGLDLTAADLVVLSACATQIGPVSSGDDLLALNRSFLYAGASTVVASLWVVDGASTRLLMVSSYSHLQQGQSKVEALRAAQAEVRASHPNPYYWAGFVLTGDPGPTHDVTDTSREQGWIDVVLLFVLLTLVASVTRLLAGPHRVRRVG
jgi:CHAT domain-containing protein